MSTNRQGSEAGRAQRVAPELQGDQSNEIPANRARQGVTGHNVRRVLAFGTAGAVIVLAAIYLLVAAGQL
jgi:hypothetical protein